MLRFPSPERLARFSTRRPGLVIGIWAVFIILAVVSASQIGKVLTASAEIYKTTDSSSANQLIEARLHGTIPVTETVVVQSNSSTVDDPAYRTMVTGLTQQLRGLSADVAQVTNIYEQPSAPLASADRRTTLLPLTLTGDKKMAEVHVAAVLTTLTAVDGQGGFTVVTAGDGSVGSAFTEASKSDLETAEVLGIPLAIVILIFVFGALVAAGMPIVLGIVSIIVSLGITALVGRAFELSTFVVNFVTTMGLAVGIDYSLIIIQRFREERRNGLERDDAIVKAGATASRAVLFSGLSVMVALAGMMIVPQSIFRSLGVGAILVVATAVVAALTLLPATLRLLGDRVNGVTIRLPGLSRRSGSPSFWARTTGIVMRHPVISVVASVTLLVTASLPYASIKLGWAGVSSLPQESSAHRAFTILSAEFPGGVLAPAEIVIDAPDVTAAPVKAAEDQLLTALKQDLEFGQASFEQNANGDLMVIRVTMAGDPSHDVAQNAIQRLRAEYIPASFKGSGANVLVTGTTAEDMDATQVISDYTLPVFVFVLGLSFVILLVVFRSIVVPLKAMIMNLLSVGAAYGLVVLVCQQGVGADLLGFQQVERIETWVPLFMFAVLFGLSMDYHVFLLTRIRERFEHTGNNAESVAYGVQSTAGMITGAAAIMVAVFAGFATGQLAAFQQMGFGLAIAVFLDATVVRIVLVPASMELLGDRNWYLPRWLNWLPKVDVEGKATPAPARPRAATPAILPAPAAD